MDRLKELFQKEVFIKLLLYVIRESPEPADLLDTERFRELDTVLRKDLCEAALDINHGFLVDGGGGGRHAPLLALAAFYDAPRDIIEAILQRPEIDIDKQGILPPPHWPSPRRQNSWASYAPLTVALDKGLENLLELAFTMHEEKWEAWAMSLRDSMDTTDVQYSVSKWNARFEKSTNLPLLRSLLRKWKLLYRLPSYAPDDHFFRFIMHESERLPGDMPQAQALEAMDDLDTAVDMDDVNEANFVRQELEEGWGFRLSEELALEDLFHVGWHRWQCKSAHQEQRSPFFNETRTLSVLNAILDGRIDVEFNYQASGGPHRVDAILRFLDRLLSLALFYDARRLLRLVLDKRQLVFQPLLQQMIRFELPSAVYVKAFFGRAANLDALRRLFAESGGAGFRVEHNVPFGSFNHFFVGNIDREASEELLTAYNAVTVYDQSILYVSMGGPCLLRYRDKHDVLGLTSFGCKGHVFGGVRLAGTGYTHAALLLVQAKRAFAMARLLRRRVNVCAVMCEIVCHALRGSLTLSPESTEAVVDILPFACLRPHEAATPAAAAAAEAVKALPGDALHAKLVEVVARNVTLWTFAIDFKASVADIICAEQFEARLWRVACRGRSEAHSYVQFFQEPFVLSAKSVAELMKCPTNHQQTYKVTHD